MSNPDTVNLLSGLLEILEELIESIESDISKDLITDPFKYKVIIDNYYSLTHIKNPYEKRT